MKAKEHLGKFVNFNLTIFIYTFTLSGIFWLLYKLYSIIKSTILYFLDHSQIGHKKELEEAAEYFKKHGIECPNCGKHVPREFQCCVCKHVLVEGISHNTRKLLESK